MKLRPSFAKTWANCPGSLALIELLGIQDTGNRFAREGTAAHILAEKVLRRWLDGDSSDASQYIGNVIEVEGDEFTVDETMAEYVAMYTMRVIDRVFDLKQAGYTVTLSIEVPLDFGAAIGYPGQKGTADALIVAVDKAGNVHVEIHDLKYGQGVRVLADSEQLKAYALGAVAMLELSYEIETVHLVIHQPRITSELSEITLDTAELEAFGQTLKDAAGQVEKAMACEDVDELAMLDLLHAGEDQCRWCPAKAQCPTFERAAVMAVADDFVDMAKPLEPQLSGAVERAENSDNAHLAQCYAALPIVELWIKTVKDRIREELDAGHTVPGYKLVNGRAGSRAWMDEAEAEEVLKAMRIPAPIRYTKKIITPTQAERLAKRGEIGPVQWEKLQDHITRPAAKPSIAPVSDPRPAIAHVDASDFD